MKIHFCADTHPVRQISTSEVTYSGGLLLSGAIRQSDVEKRATNQSVQMLQMLGLGQLIKYLM